MIIVINDQNHNEHDYENNHGVEYDNDDDEWWFPSEVCTFVENIWHWVGHFCETKTRQHFPDDDDDDDDDYDDADDCDDDVCET